MADTSATLLLRTEPIGKLLLRYSLPAIAAMVVFSLYNIIDSIFIGHGVGPLAISGLAITFPVMNLTFALVLLVGIGGASICSIRLGQQDIDGATRVLGNVLLLGLILHYDAECRDALEKNAPMQKLFAIPARVDIGRAKSVPSDEYEQVYAKIAADMTAQIKEIIAGGEEQ